MPFVALPICRAPRSLTERALSNVAAPTFLALIVMLGGAACDRPQPQAGAPGTAEAAIAELVEVFTPLDRTVTSDVEDEKFRRGLEVLEKCSNGGVAVGRAALAVLREQKQRNVPVERALLTVAARAATAETAPLLENMVKEYGVALELRTEALLQLSEVAPERALAVLEPIITKQKQLSTMPPQEFLVRAWVTACERTGRSPVPELCDVATNMFQEGAARVRSVKELAKHKDPRAEAALRTILVESTGDGYLRRMTVQSLHTLLPAETACVLFREVASKEADLNMLKFLADVLEKWCAAPAPR